jgi:hypothetical protein
LITSALFAFIGVCLIVPPLAAQFDVYRILRGELIDRPIQGEQVDPRCKDDVGDDIKRRFPIPEWQRECETRKEGREIRLIMRAMRWSWPTPTAPDVREDALQQQEWEFLVLMISFTGVFQVCWMAMTLLSPLQQLIRRLSFVVLGVLTLVGLSELSKLKLHQYLHPTKVSDNSLR